MKTPNEGDLIVFQHIMLILEKIGNKAVMGRHMSIEMTMRRMMNTFGHPDQMHINSKVLRDFKKTLRK